MSLVNPIQARIYKVVALKHFCFSEIEAYKKSHGGATLGILTNALKEDYAKIMKAILEDKTDNSLKSLDKEKKKSTIENLWEVKITIGLENLNKDDDAMRTLIQFCESELKTIYQEDKNVDATELEEYSFSLKDRLSKFNAPTKKKSHETETNEPNQCDDDESDSESDLDSDLDSKDSSPKDMGQSGEGLGAWKYVIYAAIILGLLFPPTLPLTLGLLIGAGVYVIYNKKSSDPVAEAAPVTINGDSGTSEPEREKLEKQTTGPEIRSDPSNKNDTQAPKTPPAAQAAYLSRSLTEAIGTLPPRTSALTEVSEVITKSL